MVPFNSTYGFLLTYIVTTCVSLTFQFPIGYNGEFEIFENNSSKIVKKLKMSKIQNSSFVRTSEKKIQKFEKMQKWFEVE